MSELEKLNVQVLMPLIVLIGFVPPLPGGGARVARLMMIVGKNIHAKMGFAAQKNSFPKYRNIKFSIATHFLCNL